MDDMNPSMPADDEEADMDKKDEATDDGMGDEKEE